MTASSVLSLSNNVHRARLYLEIDKYSNGFTLEGGWTASAGDKQPYIQVGILLDYNATCICKHVVPKEILVPCSVSLNS